MKYIVVCRRHSNDVKHHDDALCLQQGVYKCNIQVDQKQNPGVVPHRLELDWTFYPRVQLWLTNLQDMT